MSGSLKGALLLLACLARWRLCGPKVHESSGRGRDYPMSALPRWWDHGPGISRSVEAVYPCWSLCVPSLSGLWWS